MKALKENKGIERIRENKGDTSKKMFLENDTLHSLVTIVFHFPACIFSSFSNLSGDVFILTSYRLYMDSIYTAYSSYIAFIYLSYRNILKYAFSMSINSINSLKWGGNPRYTGKSPPMLEAITAQKYIKIFFKNIKY